MVYLIFEHIEMTQTLSKKLPNSKSGLVLKLILHDVFNSRAQINLIGMQLKSINNFRFIMN